MRAIILAGGKGSRLAPFTTVIPKPLVPIGDLPILELLIRQLAAQGFDRLDISVGYLAALIESYCGDGSRWGIPITYIREDQPLGTAGFLSLVDLDDDEDAVLVVNGDTLTDLDMGAVLRRHDPTDGATIGANRRQMQIEFGILHDDAEPGYLTRYEEKPTLAFDVSMGVNIISTWAIREHVSVGERLDMPDLMRRIVAAGGRVRIDRTEAYWLDLGRLTDLEEGTRQFQEHPERFLP